MAKKAAIQLPPFKKGEGIILTISSEKAEKSRNVFCSGKLVDIKLGHSTKSILMYCIFILLLKQLFWLKRKTLLFF